MAEKPIRVMIVDDSAVIRSIIDKILKSDTAIEVCGFASDGEQAVKIIGVCKPDVVILDIEMPKMDGITALPLLLQKKPDARVLMCSTLSQRGADISIKALSLGATDCILKPSGPAAIQQSGDFHTGLLRMVREIGGHSVKPSIPSTPVPIHTRMPGFMPKILAIGSSTGGPNALANVLKDMRGFPLPIVITQHMPPTFTKMLATHLSNSTGIQCYEGENGMLLKSGCAYIAPGGYHMIFKQTAAGIEIVLNDGPLENFCKPSVNPMLRSLCEIYGSRILTVILTGMGEDGLTGARKVVEIGGQVIAQDANTSIVWGMPGAVANAGLCSAVLPLGEIPAYLQKMCGHTTAQQKLSYVRANHD